MNVRLNALLTNPGAEVLQHPTFRATADARSFLCGRGF